MVTVVTVLQRSRFTGTGRDERGSHEIRVLVLVVIAAVSVNAADPPYIGHWKLNPSKSRG
jgi:hypothetical protein